MQGALASRGAASASSGQASAVPGLEQTLAQLRHLLGAAEDGAPALSVIQASVGNTIHMVRLEDVVYLEAADKYVRVLTPEREYLIRTPLRELLPRLDSRQFWQVHRASVVRAQAIEAVTRDEAGKLWLQVTTQANFRRATSI